MPVPLRPLTWRTKSSIAGSGSGLMSWRTISEEASDGVLTMSRKSFGTHWRLAPPMITIRGAIAPPGQSLRRKPDAGVRMLPITPSHGCGEHLHDARSTHEMGGLDIHGVLDPPMRWCRSRLRLSTRGGSGELREPLGGGFEHLVGHGDDVVV